MTKRTQIFQTLFDFNLSLAINSNEEINWLKIQDLIAKTENDCVKLNYEHTIQEAQTKDKVEEQDFDRIVISFNETVDEEMAERAFFIVAYCMSRMGGEYYAAARDMMNYEVDSNKVIVDLGDLTKSGSDDIGNALYEVMDNVRHFLYLGTPVRKRDGERKYEGFEAAFGMAEMFLPFFGD